MSKPGTSKKPAQSKPAQSKPAAGAGSGAVKARTAAKGPTKYSEGQMTVLKLAFQKYDKDNSNALALSEINRMLIGFGEKRRTAKEMEELSTKSGLDPTKELTFDDFLKVASSVIKTDNPYLDLREDFADFDLDGDGIISTEELAAALTDRRTGGQLTPDDVKEILKQCDKSGDGRIDYEEFVLLILDGKLISF